VGSNDLCQIFFRFLFFNPYFKVFRSTALFLQAGMKTELDNHLSRKCLTHLPKAVRFHRYNLISTSSILSIVIEVSQQIATFKLSIPGSLIAQGQPGIRFQYFKERTFVILYIVKKKLYLNKYTIFFYKSFNLQEQNYIFCYIFYYYIYHNSQNMPQDWILIFFYIYYKYIHI